ncbi:MAG TPA: hypothetical protein VHA73_01695 [Acidimicrobiales bacterium]|nr:hypothetical protein [Acidimicrobiales bacterium]
MRHLKHLVAGAVIVAAVAMTGCSSNQKPGVRAAATATAPTTPVGQGHPTDGSPTTNGTGAGVGHDDATKAEVDPATASKAIGYVEKLIPPLHGSVPRSAYDRVLSATCTATVGGAADRNAATATANGIVVRIPKGPAALPQYRTGMILLAETYLSLDHCGAPAPYADAVLRALEPHASQALLEIVRGG